MFYIADEKPAMLERGGPWSGAGRGGGEDVGRVTSGNRQRGGDGVAFKAQVGGQPWLFLTK